MIKRSIEIGSDRRSGEKMGQYNECNWRRDDIYVSLWPFSHRQQLKVYTGPAPGTLGTFSWYTGARKITQSPHRNQRRT